MRNFNSSSIELLAPASNYDVVDLLLQSGCDAIYLGGKDFNMRMHSDKLNFSITEIRKTVIKAHGLKKLVYVTVNIWVDDSQISDLIQYLIDLDACGVDAIIIQDLAIAKLVKQYNLNMALHASVMMNIHNQMQIMQLEYLGFTRFVASRELSLATIKQMTNMTPLECEYFVSGDMCTAHGSQCYYSGLVFNKSANQGQCFKMCRWQYQLQVDDQLLERKHYLAAKDLDLSSMIEQLILSGVNSFKIEGRGKPINEILPIIDTFSNNIDQFLTNPLQTFVTYDMQNLYQREISTGYAFGNPGINYLNELNESNPNMLRIFSKSGMETRFTKTLGNDIEQILMSNNKSKQMKVKVKVENYKQAKAMLELKVDTIYLSLESLVNKLCSIQEINNIISQKQNTKVYIALPQMCYDEQLTKINSFLGLLKGIDGLLVSDLGSLLMFKDTYTVITDFNLNITNQESLAYLSELGANACTLSIELKANQLRTLLESSYKKELIVHGQLPVMLFEIDFYKAYNAEKTILLIDDLGLKHPLFRDNFNRTHLMSTKTLCLYPFVDSLSKLGLDAIQIDGRLMETYELISVVSSYQSVFNENAYNYYYAQKEKYSFHALAHILNT